VYQSAITQMAMIAVVTSRWLKRNAAQMMKGTMRKVVAYAGLPGAPPLNTAWVPARRRMAKARPSALFAGVQRRLPGAAQLRMSGVARMMPVASPCHHVSQFRKSSAPVIGCMKPRGSSANVGAIVAARPDSATNFTTSSARLKR